MRIKKASTQGETVYIGGLYEVQAGTKIKYYMVGGLRVAKRVGTTNTFFHHDHLGSTKVISNQSGAEVARYEYAPFGKVIAQCGASGDSHRYLGQVGDDASGLVYLNSRYYDSALGRFIQPDAFLPQPQSPQALDLYAYSINDPINGSDRDGNAPLVALVVAAWQALVTWAVTYYWQATIIGTLLSFSSNKYLATLGMVIGCIGGATWSGAAKGFASAAGLVSLATSPISPLSPEVKKIIGWAWTAYNFGQAWSNALTAAKAAGGGVGQAIWSMTKMAGMEVLKMAGAAWLRATGTAARPITFTSAVAPPAAGDWQGLVFGRQPAARTVLDHVTIRYAGGPSYANSFHCWPDGSYSHDENAAIAIYGQTAAFLTNSTIADCAGVGVDLACSGDYVDFRPTNTFTDVASCKIGYPRASDGSCPGTVPCP